MSRKRLTDNEMKDFYQQALEYEALQTQYWISKEQELRAQLEMAAAKIQHHSKEQLKLKKMIENEEEVEK